MLTWPDHGTDSTIDSFLNGHGGIAAQSSGAPAGCTPFLHTKSMDHDNSNEMAAYEMSIYNACWSLQPYDSRSHDQVKTTVRLVSTTDKLSVALCVPCMTCRSASDVICSQQEV